MPYKCSIASTEQLLNQCRLQVKRLTSFLIVVGCPLATLAFGGTLWIQKSSPCYVSSSSVAKSGLGAGLETKNTSRDKNAAVWPGFMTWSEN